MTTDLTEVFVAALRERHVWNRGRIRNVLTALQNCIPKTHVDWEEGDENWGRLVQDGEVVLIMNALIPLAFVISSRYEALQNVLDDCLAVPIESFSSQCFSVDRQLLEQVVGREASANVNYDQLSIDDLWWATV